MKYGLALSVPDFFPNNSVEGLCHAIQSGIFDSVQLLVVPGMPDVNRMDVSILQDIDVVIHAPHIVFGCDIGNSSLRSQNIKMFDEVRRIADVFQSKTIVVHPGAHQSQDSLSETIKQ